VAQALECLFCKHEALNSNQSPTKKNKNKNLTKLVDLILLYGAIISCLAFVVVCLLVLLPQGLGYKCQARPGQIPVSLPLLAQDRPVGFVTQRLGALHVACPGS
jgi:hypothetical protein